MEGFEGKPNLDNGEKKRIVACLVYSGLMPETEARRIVELMNPADLNVASELAFEFETVKSRENH